ncbi:MAG: hypothetical protein II670_14540 [Alphaproteobacteria bacterium]|nr:hypothetical protein [Alphaproteobacteria bacterium]
MKKKNVVKKETREKKTHERTPVRIQKPKVKKPVVVTEPVVEVVEEKEPIKKQHNKKPKTAPVEIVEVEKNIENNEQNL